MKLQSLFLNKICNDQEKDDISIDSTQKRSRVNDDITEKDSVAHEAIVQKFDTIIPIISIFLKILWLFKLFKSKVKRCIWLKIISISNHIHHFPFDLNNLKSQVIFKKGDMIENI